jgi:hypothetical protein
MQKETRYKELLDHQQESGLTIKEFCSNQGIAVATFHYWKKKLRKKPGSKNFIPIVVKSGSSLLPTSNDIASQALQSGSKSSALLEVVYPNGTILRVSSDLDLVQLRTLIHLYD